MYHLHFALSKCIVFPRLARRSCRTHYLWERFEVANNFVHLVSSIYTFKSIGDKISLRNFEAGLAFTNLRHLWCRGDIMLPLRDQGSTTSQFGQHCFTDAHPLPHREDWVKGSGWVSKRKMPSAVFTAAVCYPSKYLLLPLYREFNQSSFFRYKDHSGCHEKFQLSRSIWWWH